MAEKVKSPSNSPKQDAVTVDEGTQPWLDDLIAQARKDPGAPFRPEMLKRLAALKRDNQAKFEALRCGLKEAKVRVGELDDALRHLEKNDRATRPARALGLAEITPWPEPVDGAALLDDIVASIRRYVVTVEHAPEAIALWILHAHAHDAAQISPRLAITSPEKRCGKTTALSVIQNLVSRPLPASNITAAALFRSVEVAKPTVLIDEADTFLKGSDDLRGILNAGHNRACAYVIRTVGEDHEPTAFNTWAPVAIAMIGRLPDTLADRSIEVRMRRRLPNEAVDRFRFDRVEHLKVLARKAARWASDNEAALRDRDDDVPACLHDRSADNWRPLMAIAHQAGGDWPRKACEAAVALAGSSGDEASVSAMLLADIEELFDAQKTDRLRTQTILDHLNDKDDRLWPEWKGKPLTSRQLSKLLAPFGIIPGTVRFISGETAKGYYRASFEDAFTRYLTNRSVTTSQGKETKGSGPENSVTRDAAVTDGKAKKATENPVCDGVTDETARGAEEHEAFARAPGRRTVML